VVQDFLSETYLESLETGRVSLRSLATRLSVTPPAVSRMAQRLVRQGFLRREGACGLVLSESGERIALRAIRRRRVFEVYLVRKLGYSWDEVYPISAQSSNHLDDELIERMFQQLDRPERCPHGDPIPSFDGRLPAISASRLSDLSDGTQAVVSRVSSHDGDMLRYLASLNIMPGAPIRLMARAPFSGPLRLRVANGRFHDEHVIGAELASRIWVEDVVA
jgi:DtxR family Mn-dependent transcriptional regulator